MERRILNVPNPSYSILIDDIIDPNRPQVPLADVVSGTVTFTLVRIDLAQPIIDFKEPYHFLVSSNVCKGES